MNASATLGGLLGDAANAEPGDRIRLRDAIAAYGDEAIDAMADWLGDKRLCAFAIRVIERAGDEVGLCATAIDAILRADRTEWPSYLSEDADKALASLGYRFSSRRGVASPSPADRAVGLPGQPGRRYWVMRTSPWERPYLWAEAHEGRLRQGWGTFDEQNLDVIAESLRRGIELTDRQLEARRALKMLASWPGGMNSGDLVVAPNLPNYGRLSVFRVTGSYYWSPTAAMTWGERFGHVLPVELLFGDIDRHAAIVSDALRAALRVQTRLYGITGYGGDVELLVGGSVGADRHRERWTEAEYSLLFERYPTTGSRPSPAAAEELAMEFGRSPRAVAWEWDDGAAYVQGRSASTTSDALKTWLDQRR